MAMTSHQILHAARAGDLERLGVHRSAIADAVNRLSQVGDTASALELAGRTWRMWSARGALAEGRAMIAAALAVPGASAAPLWQVRVLCADGLFAFRAGDQARSLASNQKALVIARKTGDLHGVCDALTGLARVALRDGSYEEVVVLAREARVRAAAAGDREAGAAPLHLLAAGTRLQRDYPAARELYLESLQLNTELGNKAWVSMELHNLGWVELHLGHVDEAAARFRERDATSPPDLYAEPWTDLNWSAIAAAHGDIAEARRRFVIGSRLLATLELHPDPDDLAELEWLREQLGERNWWTRGCVSTPHSGRF